LFFFLATSVLYDKIMDQQSQGIASILVVVN